MEFLILNYLISENRDASATSVPRGMHVWLKILIGGNDAYVAMCHSCWKRAIAKYAKPE